MNCFPFPSVSTSEAGFWKSRLIRRSQEISEATGASTATISRVNRLLNDNKNGIEMAAARVSRKK